MHVFCNLTLLVIGLLPFQLLAQLDTKPLIKDVDVEEHLGGSVDLDLVFVDQNGKNVTLGSYFNGQLPTIITPVYYSCPQLCTLVLNGVARLVDQLDLKLGRDYQILSISFDPQNTPALAKAKAETYFAALADSPAAPQNWHFLTGTPDNVAKVMDGIGFRYQRVGREFSHASVIVFASPEGKITRYLYGVAYPPRDGRIALLEAAGGKVGSTMDKILVYCFRYDPLAGKYVPYAWRMMRIGSLMGLLAITALCFFLWKSEFYKRRRRQNV